MFAASIMIRLRRVAPPIPRLIPAKVIKRLCSPFRHWSFISVMRVIAIVHVAYKTMRAVKPWTYPDEHAI